MPMCLINMLFYDTSCDNSQICGKEGDLQLIIFYVRPLTPREVITENAVDGPDVNYCLRATQFLVGRCADQLHHRDDP